MWLPLPADDPDRGKRRLTRLAPGGQEVAKRWVQPPLGRQPGCEQVVVDLPDRHRPHGRVGGAVVAPGHQQDPFGRWVQLVGGHQELHPADLSHPLGGEQHGHRLRPRAQLPEGAQCRSGRALSKDLVIRPETAAKIIRQGLQRRAVLIHQKQNRRSHAPPRCDGQIESVGGALAPAARHLSYLQLRPVNGKPAGIASVPRPLAAEVLTRWPIVASPRPRLRASEPPSNPLMHQLSRNKIDCHAHMIPIDHVSAVAVARLTSATSSDGSTVPRW